MVWIAASPRVGLEFLVEADLVGSGNATTAVREAGSVVHVPSSSFRGLAHRLSRSFSKGPSVVPLVEFLNSTQ